ncbi:MAG: metalloregulator ArsR/SmtB family transcription factor [Alphaproteobacteria bacterium]|nr:metalloregulator ArsR/SmtB family transcription factor [Alphaproteobacteria bacterium]
MNIKSFCAKAERAANLMKNLSNAHRLMILCRLHEGECSVGELETLIPITQSALSQHLARLRRDGIVKTRREAQNIYYRLVDKKTSQIIKELYTIFCR